jgi:hypothetical protein
VSKGVPQLFPEACIPLVERVLEDRTGVFVTLDRRKTSAFTSQTSLDYHDQLFSR